MAWTAPRTWVAGEVVTAALLNTHIRDNELALATAPVSAEQTGDLLSLSNTTFAAGSPACGSSFTAPPFGKALITVSGHLETNTSGENCYLSFEVRTGSTVGSGTVVQTATADNGVGVTGPGVTRACACNRVLITGLTAGSSYNVQTMHVCSGGTYDVFNRRILVETTA